MEAAGEVAPYSMGEGSSLAFAAGAETTFGFHSRHVAVSAFGASTVSMKRRSADTCFGVSGSVTAIP